jgi:hypothetical protein
MAEHESREVWVKRVERWGDSGLTAGEFASEIGVNPRTLTYWKWRLGAEQRKARRPKALVEPAAVAAPALDFVEVKPEPQPMANEPFELVVGAVTVRVPNAFDPHGLRRLLEVVRA